MTDQRKDLPPVNSPNFLEKVREALGVYLGNRGDGLDRGVTLRDLQDSGLVNLRSGFGGSGGTRNPIGGAGSLITDASEYVVDLTPPPTPSGFSASAAISNILVECGAPTYSQGNGHAKSRLYGASWTSGPLPVFSDAKMLTEFQGTVASHATNPATTWHLWLTWVTNDAVESTSPAGDTNGVVTRTGEDVALLLTALTGEITASQLYQDLATQIDDSSDGVSYLATQSGVRVQSASDGRTVIGGFGVMGSTAGTQGPTIDFGVLANKFYVAAPASSSGVPSTTPFVVQSTATEIGGVAVPAGVYINDAYIKNGTITSAKIGFAAIDDAKIANLSAAKLTAGDGTIGGNLKSADYISGAAGQGWMIPRTGNAELNNATVRGTVEARAGQIGGITIASNAVRAGQSGFNTGQGFYLGANGMFSLGNSAGNRLTWDGSGLNINGAINVGDFTGYVWPAPGKSGAHLSGQGLLLGNYNNQRYFQVTAEGDVFTPGFEIRNGKTTITALDVVDTLNIAGEAATAARGNSTQSGNSVAFALSLKTSAKVIIIATVHAPNTYRRQALHVTKNGTTTEVVSESVIGGSSVCFVYHVDATAGYFSAAVSNTDAAAKNAGIVMMVSYR